MDTGVNLGTALTTLSIAFGVWAWVVAWGVSVIRKEVQEMKKEAHAAGITLTAHVNQTERRLTMLEAEFKWIKESVRSNNRHKDEE